jgi:hypothetical protein
MPFRQRHAVVGAAGGARHRTRFFRARRARWAKVVFNLLRPGGELYLYEFHPLKWIFGETDRPEILDAYFTPAEGFRLGGVTYAEA